MTGAPFLFGKLPAHGDFVARGLEPGVERAWDEWAGREIGTAREALGDDFEAAHDATPPWAFVSGPGPLGEGWRWGAVAASVDSAGRRFLVVAGVDGVEPADAAFAGHAGVQAADAAIRAMLVDGLDADTAVSLLAPSPVGQDAIVAGRMLAPAPGAGVWWSLAGITPPLAGDAPPAGLVSGTLSRVSALLKDAA